MTYAEKKKRVLMIPIPEYFYEIIVPNLSSYYDGDYPVDFDYSLYVKCCFHDENTPSMRYFDDTNMIHCFGCGFHANIIWLHIMFVKKYLDTTCSEEEAVNFLYKYFVSGNTDAKIFVASGTKPKLNSGEDMARINIYRKNLERSLNVDHSISEDRKKPLWRLMDDIDVFLEKDMIQAIVAEKTLKEGVRHMLRGEKQEWE